MKRLGMRVYLIDLDRELHDPRGMKAVRAAACQINSGIAVRTTTARAFLDLPDPKAC